MNSATARLVERIGDHSITQLDGRYYVLDANARELESFRDIDDARHYVKVIRRNG